MKNFLDKILCYESERFQVGVENEKNFFSVLSERGELLSTECVEKKTRRFGLLRLALFWMKTRTECDREKIM